MLHCNAIIAIVPIAIVAMHGFAYIEILNFYLIVSLFVCCLSCSELPSINIDHAVEQLCGMG